MPEKETDTIEKKNNTGFNIKKLITKIFKILTILFLSIITLFLIFFILFQFKFFRGFIINTVLNEVNKELIARIELDDIRINPFKGIDLINFRMITRGDTMVYVPHLFVSIDVPSALNNKIIINRAEIDNPFIKITRSKDGTWTYDHIAKPSTDTTPPQPTDLDIIINHFRISDGSFIFIDSIEADLKKKGDFVINFKFRDIQFLSDGIIELKDSRFYFYLKLLKFYEEIADFHLEELSGKIGFDNDYLAISKLLLKFEESDLFIDLYSKYPWMLFSNDQYEKLTPEFYLSINSDKLDSKDISKIYDISKYFSGDIKLDCKGKGTKNSATIDSLSLTSNSFNINLNGSIYNFDKSEQMRYGVKVKDSYIYPQGLKSAIPLIQNINIPFKQKVNINNLEVSGSSDKIKMNANILSEIGKIDVQASINSFARQEYEAKLSVSNFNTTTLNVYNLNSNFNANIKGQCFELEKASSQISLEIYKTRFENILIDKGTIACNIYGNGIIHLDTAEIIFDSSMVYNKEFNREDTSKLTFNGFMDLNNPHLPRYKINTNANGVNISQISNDKSMPVSLSGKFVLEGTGFVPDSIEASLDVDIEEALFSDKALFPFGFSVELSRTDSNSREIKINSDFIKLKLAGNFNYSNILSLLNTQGIYLTDYISKKINSISPLDGDTSKMELLLKKVNKFSPLNLSVNADINNLYFLAPFIKEAKLDAQASLKMNLNVKEDSSILVIDTANLSYLEYDNGRTRIIFNPTQISGNLLMLLIDSLPYLNNFDLNAISDNDIRINENSIKNPKVFLKLYDDYLDFKLSSVINNIIDFYTFGNLFFDSTKLDFNFDSLFIDYNNVLSWHSTAPLKGYLNTAGVQIDKLELKREDAESISITGNIDDKSIDSLKIQIKSFPLNNIDRFFSNGNISGLETFEGNIDSLGIILNGAWDSLRIDLGLRTGLLNWKNIKIGNLLGKLAFQDNYLTGGLGLFTFDNGILNSIFNVYIRTFPLNLFPKGENKEIFYGTKPIDINIIGNNLPINYISSFAREIENIKGTADIKFDIDGYLPDKVEVNGSLNIDPTSFLLTLNNMAYSIQGEILLNNDSIIMNQLYLRNNPKDLEQGKVEIYGKISLKDFNPKDFYITMESSGFKILSDASVKSMPGLFGDVIISTGPNPLRIYGNTSAPTVDGDINVLKANLNMPNIVGKQSLQSNIIYRINGNNLKVEYTNNEIKPNELQDNNVKNVETKEFANTSGNIEVDLSIRVPNNIKIKMELGSIEELNAEIGVPDRTTPLRFYLPRGSSNPKMTGELIVREGSKLKIYKTFNTSGKVSFPTGQIDDPTLDLRAEYFGKNTTDNKLREYQVILTVKGTKSYPIIHFDYIIDGKQAIGDSSTITQDAIFLLLFGKTKTELFASEGMNSNITEDISRTGLSMYFSKFLSDLLGSSGFIQDTDIDFSSGSWEDATVKVSGQLGGATWKIGGNVSDFYYNNEFSIEFPLPLILHPKFLNNIILQFTRSTNTASPTTKDQKEWEVRLKFGGSW